MVISKNVEEQVRSGSVILKQKLNVRADCWRTFMEIYSNGVKLEGYAACKYCFTVMSASPSAGTRHLNSHALSCKSKDSQCKILKFIEQPDKKLPTEEIQMVKDSLVKYVCLGLNSFKSVESEGLKQLCNTMIKIGANHGNVNVETFFPGRLAVKKN